MSDIGRRLRAARTEAGFGSISDFLTALRDAGTPLARTVVYDAESGRRPPTEATLRAYAAVLHRPELTDLGAAPWAPVGQPADKPTTWSGSLLTGLVASDRRLSDDGIIELESIAREFEVTEDLVVAEAPDEIASMARSLVARAVCLALQGQVKLGIGSDLFLYQPGENPGFPGDITAEEWGPVWTAALKVGLDVVHVRSEFPQSDDRHGLSRDLRGLLGYRGRYQPYLVRQNAAASVPFAILSLPSVGSVQFLAAEDPRRCDVAIYFPWNASATVQAAESAIWRHVQRCADAADSIIRRYDAIGGNGAAARSAEDPSGGNDYWWVRARSERVLLDLERQPGTRYLFKDGLSTATCPTDVARARLRRARLAVEGSSVQPPLSPAVADEFDLLRGDRQREFLRNLADHEAFDFVTEASLRRYCRTGLFSERADDYWGAAARPDEVEAHLRFVLTILEQESNYRLVIISEDEAQALLAPGTVLDGAGWTLKADRGQADAAVFEVVRELVDGDDTTFVHTMCEIRHRDAVRSILNEFQLLRRLSLDAQRRQASIEMLEHLLLGLADGTAQGRHPARRSTS